VGAQDAQLRRRQRAGFAAREPAEAQGPHARPHQREHRMAEGGERPADLSLASFREHQLEARGAGSSGKA
jgi:hypothetical protein